MTLRTAFAALALVLILPLAGCDETGVSTDEASVIGDAQVARQNGDFETAVRLLETALAANPQSAPVRTELGVTILAREDLNLLDLDRISQFIVDGAAGATVAANAPAARGGTCRFASDPTAVPFDPTAVEGFPEIEASQSAIDSVLAIITPVLPAALRSFDPCTTIAPDGSLVYDRVAVAAQLRASGLTDAQISQLLATNALARFLSAYLFVTTEVPQQTSWYRLADGSIGVCATDEDALLTQTRGAVSTLGTALTSLDTRARSFGGASDIVDLATDAFADIREALGEYCASV
ncbi:MAG TPA: hypothetical protein VGB53_01805 [Rubricoccaceae bacterium]|jgi:hypothetical protein